MNAFDTNILLHAHHSGSPLNGAARAYLGEVSGSESVVLCELVLVELYVLLRNPAVVSKPLSASSAADIVQAYRQHPRWRVVENADVMQRIWALARESSFARRRIFDTRLGTAAGKAFGQLRGDGTRLARVGERKP